jgi:uncharacterized coiled-coil DUF342 family protein
MDSNIKELEERAEKISREIHDTREAIKALKEKRLQLLSELKEIRGRRAALLEELRKAKSKLRESIEERRKLISEVKSLVEERRKLLGELKAIRELVQSKKATFQSLAEEVKIPISIIKRKIEELEWYMQTHILTLEEEKQVVRRLQAYNSLLKRALNARRERDEYLELRALHLSLKSRIAELTSKISELKSTISEKSRELEALRSNVNARLSEYMNTKNLLENKKKEIEACDTELAQKIARLNVLRQEYNDVLKSIAREKEKSLLELKRRDLLSKISENNKKRFSLEELKILYGVSEGEEEL